MEAYQSLKDKFTIIKKKYTCAKEDIEESKKATGEADRFQSEHEKVRP